MLLRVWALLSVSVMLTNNLFATSVSPLCDNLPAVIDRPTVSYSACTVGNKKLVIEAGYDKLFLGLNGQADFFPQMEVRWGMGERFELDFFPPSLYRQEPYSKSGLGALSLGSRYLFYNDAHQLFTVQGYVTPASGSEFYGVRHTNFLLNAIYSYTTDSGVYVAALAGVALLSTSKSQGNQSFYSFNPITVFSFPLTPSVSPYVEFFAQSKTLPSSGWGVSMDTGLIFSVTKNMTIDVEFGQQLLQYINGIQRYWGAGWVIQF